MRPPVLTLLGLSALLAACAAPLHPDKQPIADLVQSDDGALAWAGLELGTSHARIERKAGKSLPIGPQANPACGQFATVTSLYGRKLTLQWSGAGDDAVLDTLAVELPESSEPAPALAARIHARLPELTEQDTPEGNALLRSGKGEVVLIKTAKEHFLLLSPATCLD
jgi:hypothetical protein